MIFLHALGSSEIVTSEGRLTPSLFIWPSNVQKPSIARPSRSFCGRRRRSQSGITVFARHCCN
jgi:hypothetical protein